MTTVSCRKAGPGDLAALGELGSEIFRQHGAEHPDIFADTEDPACDAALWRDAVEGDGNVAFVIERQSRIVGFVTGSLVDEPLHLFRPRRYCCVGFIGVRPGQSGRGYGTALMAAIERWAVEQSADEVQLNVWTFNQSALRLYTHLGYGSRTQLMVKPLARNAS